MYPRDLEANKTDPSFHAVIKIFDDGYKYFRRLAISI